MPAHPPGLASRSSRRDKAARRSGGALPAVAVSEPGVSGDPPMLPPPPCEPREEEEGEGRGRSAGGTDAGGAAPLAQVPGISAPAPPPPRPHPSLGTPSHPKSPARSPNPGLSPPQAAAACLKPNFSPSWVPKV